MNRPTLSLPRFTATASAWLFRGSLLVLATAAHAAVSTTNLRCEYLTEPRGIDTVEPRLSWVVESLDRGEKQTAWQLLVASSPSLLAQDEGDLWDSGKVAGDQTYGISYKGLKLPSRSQCFWKVRSWGKAGEPSEWSKIASWTIGLIEPSDWSAKWVDASPRQKPSTNHLTPVITAAAYEAVDGAGSLDVTTKLKSLSAQSTFAVDVLNETFGKDPAYNHPKHLRVDYQIGGTKTSRLFPEKSTLHFPGDLPEPPQITRATYEANDGNGSRDVTRNLADRAENGQFALKVDNPTLGDDPAPQRLKKLRIEYVSNGEPGVKMIAENATFNFPTDLLQAGSIPYLRRSFEVAKPVARATVYATALGIYEMRLNGQQVGDHFLAPEWTDFAKRVRYQEYDVTAQILAGKNVLGAQVANGWYSGHIGNGGFQYWGKSPALFAQLEITYKDGTTERIVTDEKWKTGQGALRATDFMLGEEYDSRKELAGWDRPGFDDASWLPVITRAEIPREINGQVMEPVRKVMELQP